MVSNQEVYTQIGMLQTLGMLADIRNEQSSSFLTIPDQTSTQDCVMDNFSVKYSSETDLSIADHLVENQGYRPPWSECDQT